MDLGTSQNSFRPDTSSSRQAWGDELYSNDPESARNVPAPYAERGDAPVAMESEVMDHSNRAVKVKQRPRNMPHGDGFWPRFKGGVRSIWMTKQTEDTEHDRELYIRATLRELIIYILFLIVLCILTFGMTSSTMYYYTKVMSELFLDKETPLTEISDMSGFWEYAEGDLMKGLYWEKWYDLQPITEEQRGFIFYENKLLGRPRMRMLRVNSDTCSVADPFTDADLVDRIEKCFDPYKKSNELQDTIISTTGLTDTTYKYAFEYQDSKTLSAGSYWGTMGTYGGGGYVMLLSDRRNESEEIISTLKAERWIDRHTRVVFIDFTVYNANINLFCVAKLVFEFPATGGVLPSASFRTVKLIRYVTVFDYFVLACEGIFCAFILYYIIEEVIEIVKHKLQYFKNFWNILDIVVIGLSLCCIGFSIFRTLVIEQKLDDLLAKPNEFANFESLSYAQTRFNDGVAILVFFAWIKIFKYISFNRTMNQLSTTLSRCAKDVGGFAIMFFIFFFAYAQLGYLIFGTQVKDFSTFYDAVFTLLRTILGDFNFYDLENANRVLGPIFFITYIFFVFFILLNMFLAIINDTYAEVKAELATQKNDFEIGDFFKRGYYNMLRKMNLYKDNMKDIKEALEKADYNHDKKIDYDEWRHFLKKRGYVESEIELMFSKFDVDGDRVLDEEEQRKMKRMVDGLDNRDLVNQEGDGVEVEEGEDGPGFGGLGGGSKHNRGIITLNDFNFVNRRVDKMEHSIGSVANKISAVLQHLQKIEEVKKRHRQNISRVISEAAASNESEQKTQLRMEDALRKEMDRFELDAGQDF